MEKGLAGGNKGLNMGLPRLQRFIPGLQGGTFHLIGGEPGTGKSAFTDQSYIYFPYQHVKDCVSNPKHPWYGMEASSKFKVFKESLEIEKRAMIVKAACWRLYLATGILTDINTVLSRGENRCPQELYDQVVEQLGYFEEMEECVEISDHSNNPTGMNKKVRSYLLNHGKEVHRIVDNGDGPRQIFDHYVPDDSDRVVTLQVDHIGLMRGEGTIRAKKDIIEKLSTDYCIPLRNNYGVSPVLVSQLNRSLSSADRAKIDRIQPQLSDFKESAATQEDANIILTLFSPHRYKIPNYGATGGYDISKLKNRFISCSILKNRDGEADKMLGLKFLGECGFFEELPTEADMKVPGAYEKVLAI